MVYFGTRLSDNLSRREPEGYLICLNVPVARTGMQEYLPEELGLPPGGGPVPVFRPEEEVFDRACLASFEGMPVTDDHPSFPEGVNAENIRYLQKGHAHNVRRGAGAEADLLLADLIITDPVLIEEILNGKREISCGYNYTLREENGRYVQRDIRGNHVAVVDAGRAGPRVSIRDHAGVKAGKGSRAGNGAEKRTGAGAGNRTGTEKRTGTGAENRTGPEKRTGIRAGNRFGTKKQTGNERRSTDMNQTREKKETENSRRSRVYAKRTARLMARMARDGETGELAEMIAELVDPGVQEPVLQAEPAAESAAEAAGEIAGAVEEMLEEAGAGDPVTVEVPENREITVDCGEQIISLLQQIVSFLQPAADCGGTPVKDEDPADAAAEALAEAVTEAIAGPAPADPVEALVAEAVKEAVQENPEDAAAVIGEAVEAAMTDPEGADEDPASGTVAQEEEEAACRTADALRTAMATFRPILKTLAPEVRSRAVQKIAANLRAKDRSRSAGKTGGLDTYALLRGASRKSPADPGADLGRRIMEKRNANLRRG